MAFVHAEEMLCERRMMVEAFFLSDCGRLVVAIICFPLQIQQGISFDGCSFTSHPH